MTADLKLKSDEPALAGEYPALRALGLTAADLAILVCQGFVSSEVHGGRPRFKLRFRVDGAQRVRCIPNRRVAEKVAEELAGLQIEVRRRRELARLGRSARGRLRNSKEKMAPVLEESGYHFHGRQIRKRREPANYKSDF